MDRAEILGYLSLTSAIDMEKQATETLYLIRKAIGISDIESMKEVLR